MANYEKFTRGDYGLFAHCERKKEEFGNYITLGNQRIDPSRSHLNYNLMLPLLKNVVQKMLGAFEWARGAQEQVRKHVEHARTSIRAKLP